MLGHRSLIRQTLHYFARPHQGPATGPLNSPAAWTVPELGEDWRITLGERQRDAVDAAVRAMPPGPLSARRPAELTVLADQVAAWRAELARGRGFVVIRGFPVERWTEAQREAFFWTFGLLLGTPGAQNPRGDLLGHVRDEGFDHQRDVRGYRTRAHIRFHCDAADVVGLMCLSTPARGGRSYIASSVAIFNELRRRRPDLVSELYEPFAFDTKAEGGLQWFAIEPCRFADGQLRTFFHSDYFRSAARHADAPPLTPARDELLTLYDAIASEPQHRLSMLFEPGDIQLISNHTIVHSREAYEDDEAHRRHLLRLWVSLPDSGGGARAAYARLVGRLVVARLRARLTTS